VRAQHQPARLGRQASALQSLRVGDSLIGLGLELLRRRGGFLCLLVRNGATLLRPQHGQVVGLHTRGYGASDYGSLVGGVAGLLA